MKPALMPPEGYVVNYNDNMAIELFFMGLVSLGLTTVNVVSIFIMAYLVLKVSKLSNFWITYLTVFPKDKRSRANELIIVCN